MRIFGDRLGSYSIVEEPVNVRLRARPAFALDPNGCVTQKLGTPVLAGSKEHEVSLFLGKKQVDEFDFEHPVS